MTPVTNLVTSQVTIQTSAPHYRADIDGLRALAVLSVVGFHAFPARVRGGFIGVDIFFVISGFLISTIIFGGLQRNSFSFVEFYGRRIRRIFPALLVVLIATCCFGWFVLLPDDYKQLGEHVAGGAGFVSNFVLWNESGYFDNAADTKPLLHLWSLGIEEQFYIIWPLLLWLTYKLRLNLLTVPVVVGIISFALNISSVHKDAVAAFYSPPTRFWELLAGSVLAYVSLSGQHRFAGVKHTGPGGLFYRLGARAREAPGNKLGNLQSWAGAAMLAAGILVISQERAFPGWWAVLPIAGAVLIISAGTQAWLNRKILSNPVVVWFGLISFPLYLWHWPLLSFARILEDKTPSTKIRLAAVLISIVLAWLTYKLIEIPIRFGGRRNVATVTLLSAMAVVGYAGYDAYRWEGLPFRFPKMVQEVTQFKYDYQKGYREGSCFLRPEQDYTAFSACGIQAGDESKPSLVLWGDSHAAHLYQGYRAVFGAKYNIIQRTAASCPPILDMDIVDRPHCREINDHTYKLIEEKKPAKVILAAAWTILSQKKLDEAMIKLERTVAQLHGDGITGIALVGPVPQWISKLPHELYLYSLYNQVNQLPQRMNFGLNPKFTQVEPLLRQLSKRLQIEYMSPAEVMCDESGCLTRVGETADTLTTWEYAHLTESASRFLVSGFPQN